MCLFQITQDDIRKTYGGSSGSRGYYSSAFARCVKICGATDPCKTHYEVFLPNPLLLWPNSSTNAYMLMYRLKDPSRNASKGTDMDIFIK